jgi:RNA polymerase sigma-70 factor (ECF subfamily)
LETKHKSKKFPLQLYFSIFKHYKKYLKVAPSKEVDLSQISDFKKVFDDCYVPLCLFAEADLNNCEDAADSVQNAFIKLWERRSHFNHLLSIKTFLYKTIRNDSLNRLSHQKVVGRFHKWFMERNSDLFFRDHVIEQECFHLLYKAIDALPEQTHKVILLALEGKENLEIAETLGMAKGTVQTHKKIAYRRLRERLKDLSPLFPIWLLWVIR